MEYKRHCNGQIFYLISPSRETLRWLPHNRVHARVLPWSPIHHSDLQPEQAPREQEKATGTCDRREIYMKIERRIDAFCIKLMYRESCAEIFSSCVMRLARVP